jgi:dihydropteroate synthase
MSKQSGRGRVAGLPEWDRCAVMGVVNVTPDSFSDGGRWFDTTAAVKHGLELVTEGADLVDVGGESTRPGATRVDEAEELKRVIPVVRGLASEGVVVSVDTMRASVAEQALAAGAALVNDVSGGLADPAMVPVVADAGAPFIVMHWRGFLEGGNIRGVYADVVTEVADELHARVEAVLEGGIAPDRVVVDPGLGFSKDAEHDLTLIAHLDRLLGLGHPLLVAASRKRFLGHVLAGPESAPPPARERDAATAAVSALAAHAGAWAVRVHEVRATADAVRVARAIDGARATENAPGSDIAGVARWSEQAPGAKAARGAPGVANSRGAEPTTHTPGADATRGAQSTTHTPGGDNSRRAQTSDHTPSADTPQQAQTTQRTPGTDTPRPAQSPEPKPSARTPESAHSSPESAPSPEDAPPAPGAHGAEGAR